MPKKDTSAAVLGMLSSAGAQTRSALATPPEPAAVGERSAESPTPEPAAVGDGQGSVSTLPTSRTGRAAAEEAPRTLRLRANTAVRLRNAWLQAKRDDVLLTAQDFASDLVEEALARRRRHASSS